MKSARSRSRSGIASPRSSRLAGRGGMLLLVLMLAGAGHERSGGAAPARAADVSPAPAPPKLRLGDAARPTRCALDLTVVPSADTFTGAIDIDVQLRQPTSLLWLDAAELTIGEAHAQVGDQSIPARVVPGGAELAGFAFQRPIGPGPVRLHVAYQGKMPEKESAGLFRRKSGADWYAFSQFEPIDARRAFPCFDEPGFKQPWQLTLHVPKALTALSNTPVLSETNEPGGLKAVLMSPSRRNSYASSKADEAAARRVKRPRPRDIILSYVSKEV